MINAFEEVAKLFFEKCGYLTSTNYPFGYKKKAKKSFQKLSPEIDIVAVKIKRDPKISLPQKLKLPKKLLVEVKGWISSTGVQKDNISKTGKRKIKLIADESFRNAAIKFFEEKFGEEFHICLLAAKYQNEKEFRKEVNKKKIKYKGKDGKVRDVKVKVISFDDVIKYIINTEIRDPEKHGRYESGSPSLQLLKLLDHYGFITGSRGSDHFLIASARAKMK